MSVLPIVQSFRLRRTELSTCLILTQPAAATKGEPYLFTAPEVGWRGGQAMISRCRAGGVRPREG